MYIILFDHYLNDEDDHGISEDRMENIFVA